MTSWTDCKREDLRFIPVAEAAGYTVRFAEADQKAGRTTPDNVPHNCPSFVKDCGNGVELALWFSGHNRNMPIRSAVLRPIEGAHPLNKEYSDHESHLDWQNGLEFNESRQID